MPAGAAGTAGMTRGNLDLAPIGNGRVGALVDDAGRIVWWCFPKLDGDPVFCRLLAGDEEKGFCDVVVDNLARVEAAYRRNSAVFETRLTDRDGNVVKITDFIPRFRRFERIHNPPQLFRRIEPEHGLPRVTVRVRPTANYGHACRAPVQGANHLRWSSGETALRLTTDGPISYIVQEAPMALLRPINLILGPDEPVEASITHLSGDFLERTDAYWQDWVRSLGVPLEWQAEVIRAAITLKLCSCDETGAIVAALTTSIPEAPNTARTWDYRYCWPRDAWFVIEALNRLNTTQTMEAYLGYHASIALDAGRHVRPMHGIVHNQDLTEVIMPDLAGFRGMGPVRRGNQAAEQIQHDIFGSIILAVSQMFVDERLPQRGDAPLFKRLERLGEEAHRLALEPDAGIWEFRGRKRVHTHSAAMCWAACDRLAGIARRLGLNERASFWGERAATLKATVLERAWNERRGAFTVAFGSDDLDASVLLLPDLGLLPPRDPRFVATVERIGAELLRDGYMMRYTAHDDFGAPETAFLACQFWYIDALAAVGRTDEARRTFADLLSRRNAFGVLSEDLDTRTHQLWGNIPQTYAAAGIVNTAMRLSRPWTSAWQAWEP